MLARVTVRVDGARCIFVLLFQGTDSDEGHPTTGEVVLPHGVHIRWTLCVPLQPRTPQSQRSGSSVASNGGPCSYDPPCTNFYSKVGWFALGGWKVIGVRLAMPRRES